MSTHFNVFKLEQIFEVKTAGSAEDIDRPPVGVEGGQLGVTVDVLHELPECRPVRTPEGREGRPVIVPEWRDWEERGRDVNTFLADCPLQISACIYFDTVWSSPGRISCSTSLSYHHRRRCLVWPRDTFQSCPWRLRPTWNKVTGIYSNHPMLKNRSGGHFCFLNVTW